MKRSLRWLGLATVLGAAAIVAAQQSAGRPAPPTFAGATANGARLTGVAVGSDGMTSNEVTQLLVRTMIARKETVKQRVVLAGQEDRIPLLIRANCASILTVLTPEQREREIKVWELDRYVPNDPSWAAVTRAPQIAKRLHSVSASVDAKVRGFLEGVADERREYYADFERAVEASADYRAATTDRERHLVRNRMLQESFETLPLIDRAIADEERYRRAIEKARPLLTSEQRAEFDVILNRADALLKKAASGINP